METAPTEAPTEAVLTEAVKKMIKSILNKLSAENYARLSVQLLEIVKTAVTRAEQLAVVCCCFGF